MTEVYGESHICSDGTYSSSVIGPHPLVITAAVT